MSKKKNNLAAFRLDSYGTDSLVAVAHGVGGKIEMVAAMPNDTGRVATLAGCMVGSMAISIQELARIADENQPGAYDEIMRRFRAAVEDAGKMKKEGA